MKYIFTIISIGLSSPFCAQELLQIPIADPLEPISNTAITCAEVNEDTYVYSFAGISDINSCGTPHLRSYKYSLRSDEWSSIPDLPDSTGGVIAAGASTINNKIYIVGGYQVRGDCSEYTSPFFHSFDPETETYTRLNDIPKPVDDHVQVVWRDSLLILITGWSNTTNVINVQIYNPSLDTWTEGSRIPNSGKWRVFGASGSIIGDTIYFAGGASPTCNTSVCFPPTKYFRKGAINPNDPNEITWLGFDEDKAQGYRMAASTYKGKPIWFGGANVTYNFDAIDYNSGEVVQPNRNIRFYDPASGAISILENAFPPAMDFRGVAKIAEGEYIFVGGIGEDQEVLQKALRLKVERLSTGIGYHEVNTLSISPNPASSFISITTFAREEDYSIFNELGELVLRGKAQNDVNISSLKPGVYFVQINSRDGLMTSRFIKL